MKTMKRRYGLFLVFALLIAGPDVVLAANQKDIAAGKVLAQKLCSRCHSIDVNGDSPNVKAPPFRTFAQKWPVENLEEALAEGIVVGEHIMPEFEFNPNQIDNLLGFIGSLSD